jgi:hypothetical protein
MNAIGNVQGDGMVLRNGKVVLPAEGGCRIYYRGENRQPMGRHRHGDHAMKCRAVAQPQEHGEQLAIVPHHAPGTQMNPIVVEDDGEQLAIVPHHAPDQGRLMALRQLLMAVFRAMAPGSQMNPIVIEDDGEAARVPNAADGPVITEVEEEEVPGTTTNPANGNCGEPVGRYGRAMAQLCRLVEAVKRLCSVEHLQQLLALCNMIPMAGTNSCKAALVKMVGSCKNGLVKTAGLCRTHAGSLANVCKNNPYKTGAIMSLVIMAMVTALTAPKLKRHMAARTNRTAVAA